MSKKPWRLFAAALMLIASVTAVTIAAPSAQADPTVTTIPWPGIPMPASTVYAHGDGSVSALSDDCSNHANYAGTTPSVVTFSPDYASSSTINKSFEGETVVPCTSQGESIAGVDGTIYIVQDINNSAQRIVAVRNGVLLWATAFPLACTNHGAAISSLRLGFDGNLYADDVQPTGCFSEQAELVGIQASTGHINFMTPLPNPERSTTSNEIVTYESGIAVTNNGVNVYYYSYAGVQDSSKTFSPSVTGTPLAAFSSATPDGRVYLGTNKQQIFYKDLDSATIHTMIAPTGAAWDGAARFYATPSGGLVASMRRGTDVYFGYFDASGNEVYEEPFAEPGASLKDYYFAVDNLGNVIVVRTENPSNQMEVYVDSFSPTGTKTRLFDSETSFGSSANDSFSTSIWTPQSVGAGKVYLMLCHGGALVAMCTGASGVDEKIVAIPAPSTFDYPRSEIFAAEAQKPTYVALGDSYSAGEANPPFMAGTDGGTGGDGCDRSFDAYPVQLASTADLRLSAFAACSGATSADMTTTFKTEPSQLSTLDANTALVTLTAGGNDAQFSDFALECGIGTCDADSTQYQTTTEIINDPLLLQANLEALYAEIRTTAPNAHVAVVGYPDIVVPGDSCPSIFSPGEQIAAETVITDLNNTIRTAVGDMDSNFQFVDPTATGSPFIGHNLCEGANSFFTGLSTPSNFSFHPNAAGMEAYAELIADNLP